MFRRGGSSNQGIMTGLVDRKGYQEDGFVTTVGQKAGALTPELEALLRQYTPKTRLPIGEFGLNIASGMSLTDALRDPYKRFTRADDAREAAIRGGAAKLAIAQAMKVPKDPRTPAQKNADALGLVGDDRRRYIEAATIRTDAAAKAAAEREVQKSGVVLTGGQRDKVLQNKSFVTAIRKNLSIVDEMLTEDPSLSGLSGSVRRFANKAFTAAKDFNIDIEPFLTEGGEEKVLDTDIARLTALEDAIAPAYARVLFPNAKTVTNLMITKAKDAIGLTGFKGSDEVRVRLTEIRRQFDEYIQNQETLLGNQPVLKKDLDNWFYDTKSRKLKLRPGGN